MGRAAVSRTLVPVLGALCEHGMARCKQLILLHIGRLSATLGTTPCHHDTGPFSDAITIGIDVTVAARHVAPGRKETYPEV